MTGNLEFRAGRDAYTRIRSEGFSPAAVGAVAGASGGAKWLVLSQLDRVVLDRLLPGFDGPVHTIGSSIGAWRFACYARSDPLAAIERFESAYLEQGYSAQPDRAEITNKSREILEEILGDAGAVEVLAHPVLRSSIMTVRSRRLTASERPTALGAGLALAMAANAVHRPALGGFFERGLFYDRRDAPPWRDAPGFRVRTVPLSNDNLADAILASGSIPMVLSGVADIPGAPPGIYRDGGVIDYHLDLPLLVPGRLTLYLHFFNWLKPGWFDRRLPWRRVNAGNFSSTLLICPSPSFIATLPNAKVPDRQDFLRHPHDERVRIWREVVKRCEVLAEELDRTLDGDRLPSRLERL